VTLYAIPGLQKYSKYNARMLVAEEVKKGSIKPDGTEVRIYKYKNEPQSTVSIYKRATKQCKYIKKAELMAKTLIF